MSDKSNHHELCLAVAKRYNKIFALYEYNSYASAEKPDVLVFDYSKTFLFEIKTSLPDFLADKKKDCRKKYRLQHWARGIQTPKTRNGNNKSVTLKLEKGHVSLELVEKEHLGNRRYFVCPFGLIPIDKLPEGWGLIYYENGKFYLKKESARFRSNLRTENNLAIHAMRRYASGDNTGILINTYGGKK
jgi:hypothetical protein